MSVFVKICGCRTREAVETAVDAGADALGFVFAPSPRRVSPEQARELCEGLPDHVIRVAVMHRPAPDEWLEAHPEHVMARRRIATLRAERSEP